MLLLANVVLAIATALFVVAVVRIVKSPIRLNTGKIMSVDALGKIEANYQNLRRVIVIADHVEDPERELRSAVEQNFRRGVKYLFLLSKGTAQNEVDGYYRIFEALAQIMIARHQLKYTVRDLVSIQQLPYDWPDYPYVFYEAESESPSKMTYTAFRGNQTSEGIADYYSVVPKYYAHTIARSVLSEAPQPIIVTSDQFPADSNVVSIANRS